MVSSPLYPNGADPDLVCLAGDWHGNEQFAQKAIRIAHVRGADIVVHLGDFGFWKEHDITTEDFLYTVEKTLAEADLMLVWVDGNHEDHDRLDALPMDVATGLRKISDHVWHLPRGFRWTWHGRIWMALGGAHSVDRQHRTQGLSWWPQESLSDAEVARAVRKGHVDVLVTHDAPSEELIPRLGKNYFPEEEIKRARVHHDKIRTVVELVTPEVLYHGHFHVRYDAEFEHRGGSTHVVGLAHDEGTEQDNLLLIDPKTLESTTPD